MGASRKADSRTPAWTPAERRWCSAHAQLWIRYTLDGFTKTQD
jgi:hypothetical protein